MARTWRDYEAATATSDKTDNRDERAAFEPSGTPFVANVRFVTGLPAPLRDGLIALCNAPAPRLIEPERWPIVIGDAHRLATDGWALAAIKLGWSALDLFGAVPDKSGDPDADGLAAKLGGRPVVALCGSFATVRDNQATTFLYRGSNNGARLLWELGR